MNNNLASIDIGAGFFGNNSSKFYTIAGIPSLVTLVLRTSLILASLILLYFFIIGGIGMIGSAGKNNPQAAEQAKKSISGAITGFIVVFVAYWIVKLIGQLFNIPNII